MRTKTLSSDILERQLGPTEVEVLFQDEKIRVICTRATSSGQVLELSQVSFIKAGVEKFPEIHQSVIDGQSMGKAFRQAGVTFVRTAQAAYQQALPARLGRQFGSSEPATVVSVKILVGSERTPYAEILELYSPVVIWPELFGQTSSKHQATIRQLDAYIAL